jgi:hypothetical protein
MVLEMVLEWFICTRAIKKNKYGKKELGSAVSVKFLWIGVL